MATVLVKGVIEMSGSMHPSSSSRAAPVALAIGEDLQRPAAGHRNADAPRVPGRVRLDDIAGVERRTIERRGDLATRFTAIRRDAEAELLRALAQVGLPDPTPAS